MLSYRYTDDYQNQQGPFCSLCMSKFYMKQCFRLDHSFYFEEGSELVTVTLDRLIEKYGGDDPFRGTSTFEVAPECSNPKCKNRNKSRRTPKYVSDPPIDQRRKQLLLSGLDATDNIDELIQRIDDLGFNWQCLCGFITEDKLSLLRHIVTEEHLTTNCTVGETAIDHIEKLVKDLRFAAIKNMAQTARNKSVEVDESSLMFTIKEVDPRTVQNGSGTNNHREDAPADRIPLSMGSRITRPNSRQNGNLNSAKPKLQTTSTQKPRSLFVWNPTALPLMCQRTSTTDLLKGRELFSEMEILKKRSAFVDRTLLDSSHTLKLLLNQNHCHICDVPVTNLPSSLLDHVLDTGHINRVAEAGASRDEIRNWITKIETCVRRK